MAILVARQAKYAKKYGNNGFGLTLGQATRLFPIGQEWPTPATIDGSRDGSHLRQMTIDAGARGSRKGVSLHHEVANWSTPSAHDGRRPGANLHSTQGRNLSREAATGPTPAARDYKGANSAEHVTTNGTGRMHMDQLANFVEHGFRQPLQAPPTHAGPTSRPDILSFYLRFRATTDSALRSEMRALLRMAIRSRPGKRVQGLRRPIYSGWTRRRSDPFVRPSFRRRLNPTFVEWLMRMPFGLSGFEREATELTRWLEQMRGCLSTLHSASIEPEQHRLL